MTLRAFPALNASFDDGAAAVTTYDDVHLGIAVDLDERGLVVPVVRDAHERTVVGSAGEIDRLAAAARAGMLTPDAFAGATFTITNNGGFFTLLTAPVINPPNVAIISTDAVEQRVVVVDGLIGVHRRMYLCMTWDHRAMDGSTAARFLGRIKQFGNVGLGVAVTRRPISHDLD